MEERINRILDPQLLLAAVLCGVSAAGVTALWAALIELVIMILMLVIQIKVMIRESHAYGHGGGFCCWFVLSEYYLYSDSWTWKFTVSEGTIGLRKIR